MKIVLLQLVTMLMGIAIVKLVDPGPWPWPKGFTVSLAFQLVFWVGYLNGNRA